jgi:hypothetical protein
MSNNYIDLGLPPDASGAYGFPDVKDYVSHPKASATYQPCSGSVNGFTFNKLKTITLCPNLLEGKTKVKTTITPYTDGKQKVKIGDAMAPGDSLDSYASIPATFFHEMMHLINPNSMFPPL